MKGQVFIAGAFMIAIAITLFAGSMHGMNVEVPYKNYILDNIEGEYRYAYGMQPIAAVKLFTAHLKESNRNFESAYTMIIRTETGYEILIGNYLDNDISLSITATNADPYKTDIDSQKNKETALSFASAQESRITIKYKSHGNEWTESFTSSPGDKKKILYDFSLKDDDSEIHRKGMIGV